MKAGDGIPVQSEGSVGQHTEVLPCMAEAHLSVLVAKRCHTLLVHLVMPRTSKHNSHAAVSACLCCREPIEVPTQRMSSTAGQCRPHQCMQCPAYCISLCFQHAPASAADLEQDRGDSAHVPWGQCGPRLLQQDVHGRPGRLQQAGARRPQCCVRRTRARHGRHQQWCAPASCGSVGWCLLCSSCCDETEFVWS